MAVTSGDFWDEARPPVDFLIESSWGDSEAKETADPNKAVVLLADIAGRILFCSGKHLECPDLPNFVRTPD